MKSFAAAAAALVALVPSVMGLTVNTPQGVTECQPFQFTWSGGTPPYFLSLIPGAGQAAIKQFPTQQGTSFTWNVDLQANTNFIVSLKDSTGTQAFAALATINAGTDDTCLNTAVIESGSGAGTSTGTATGGGISASSANAASTTPSGSTPSGSTPTSAASSHSGSSGSASSTASSSKASNAASVASSASIFGIAGLFGLVGAALF